MEGTIFAIIWEVVKSLFRKKEVVVSEETLQQERKEADEMLNKPRPSDDVILNELQHPDKRF